ncbi:hypothetical protein WOLCODRAFT_27778 [Wolfiporia cocos MD-104 SS10]|uniref:Uncharacterized protein n=1 Tax=Wolfiporia cocos (strain MD-104) TaxID=742152 RepID=A0A2H3IZC9_WOLCO|nr:hypothetical protein WOLCODRAFT_27778 [Wolfiporia cocos MD-104 SS10]
MKQPATSGAAERSDRQFLTVTSTRVATPLSSGYEDRHFAGCIHLLPGSLNRIDDIPQRSPGSPSAPPLTHRCCNEGGGIP